MSEYRHSMLQVRATLEGAGYLLSPATFCYVVPWNMAAEVAGEVQTDPLPPSPTGDLVVGQLGGLTIIARRDCPPDRIYLVPTWNLQHVPDTRPD